MKRVLCFGFILMTVLLCQTGCKSQPNTTPTEKKENPLTRQENETILQSPGFIGEKINVYADSYQLDCLAYETNGQVDAAMAFRELIVKEVSSKRYANSFLNLNIDFNNLTPKKVTLYDYFLAADTINDFSTERLKDKEHSLQLKQGKATYLIQQHPEVYIQSDNNREIYNGYRLVCEWEEHTTEYYFLLSANSEVTTSKPS